MTYIIYSFLCSILISTRIFATIVTYISNTFIFLMVSYIYSDITSSFSSTRNQNSRCFYSRKIIQIMNSCFQRSSFYNISRMKILWNTFSYIIIKFRIIVQCYIAISTWKNCNLYSRVCYLLLRYIYYSSRIFMITKIEWHLLSHFVKII